MNILITGSKGFVGRNLVENLKELRDRKNRIRPDLKIADIYEFDIGSSREELDWACKTCDFVFNLAGVNRPKDSCEFMEGNFGFASTLLDTLRAHNNSCPVMLSSSAQASLEGRFAGSEYGRSKLEGEKLFFKYGEETGSRVLVYRFPNLFGKWCRPNYNSAVATFCNAVANDLDYTVNDRSTQLELVYIDDVVNEMLDALEGKEHRKGRYCYVPAVSRATLGEIVDWLQVFKQMPKTLLMPEMPEGSFVKKLYSAYLSYLPASEIAYSLSPKSDKRGSFTELLRTRGSGQVSVNVAGPGITRGEHWHNSKWEIFVVVFGRGLIRQRRMGTDPETGNGYPVIETEVTGEELKAVQMLPGYTHSITNLSETENLITIMWANEGFDDRNPDTFYEPVIPETIEKG